MVKYSKFNRIGFTERHIWVTHPLKSEKHIFRVEFARWLEPRRTVKFHAAPQMECIDFPVFGDVPTFSEARFKFHPAALKFDQSVVEGGCACCELWNGSGLVCVEPCWTNVKTIDERFIRYCGDAFDIFMALMLKIISTRSRLLVNPDICVLLISGIEGNWESTSCTAPDFNLLCRFA